MKELYDKTKKYACDGCGFSDEQNTDTHTMGCGIGRKYINCDRVYEVEITPKK